MCSEDSRMVSALWAFTAEGLSEVLLEEEVS